MRIHARPSDRSDLLFSQEVESYLQTRSKHSTPTPTPNTNPNPQDSFNLVERLIITIKQYKPQSDIVDFQKMVHPQIKRYRDSVYFGEMQEGRRHGKGVMLYVGGRAFQGHWIDNVRNGMGFQRFSNGSIYRGHYLKGKPEGCGRYEWQNGEIYQGEWKGGVKHGSGIWRGAKGDSYIGEWKDGSAEGYGVHTWTNGDRYQGEFKSCLKHGEGLQRFSNGDTYKGNYSHGKPEGYGQYYWSSGSFFKGNFKNGLRNGQGVWKKGPGRSDKYEGEWLDDKKHGYGVFVWADGSVYRGHYQNDLREGFGELTRNDGSVYRGNWVNDQQSEPLQRQQHAEHDEECQLFLPSQVCLQEFPLNDGEELKILPYYSNPQEHAPPIPLYNEPQPPAILKSPSRNIRPRLSKSFSRGQNPSQIQFHTQSQYQSQTHVKGRSMGIGMTKKLSVGTVSSKKKNPYRQANEKMLASSFFLYKQSGQTTNRGGSREKTNRRQVRTSGAVRGRITNVDEELKYFARSKISSFSQLQ